MKKIIIALGITVFLSLAILTATVKAQSQNEGDTLGVTVFPAFQDTEVKPSDSTRLQVQFKNGTGSFLSGTVKFADFVVKDEMGTPLIIENQPVKPKYAASYWLSTNSPEITIPPSDFATVDIFVNVPEEVTACGHYAIVYFEPDSGNAPNAEGNTSSAASISPRVGALLNFKVNKPNCADNVKVTKFQAPFFIEHGPIPVEFNLLNLGDVHVVPRSLIMLSNMFGKTVDQSAVREFRIFPEAVKSFTPSLGHKWMIGRYKVSLNGYSNGPKNAAFAAYTYVWVFPWRLVLIIVLAIIIVALFGRNIYGRVKTHQDILEKEVENEKAEIEKLKEELKKRKE